MKNLSFFNLFLLCSNFFNALTKKEIFKLQERNKVKFTSRFSTLHLERCNAPKAHRKKGDFSWASFIDITHTRTPQYHIQKTLGNHLISNVPSN